jgi:hypothetical protein
LGAQRAAEVMQSCRKDLQTLADQLLLAANQTTIAFNDTDFSLRSIKSGKIIQPLIDD